MQISKTLFASFLILATVLGLTCGYCIQNTPQFRIHKQTTLRANVFIAFELFDEKAQFQTPNVITDIGETYTRNAFSGNSTGFYAVQWISIGNATAGTGLTQLTSQYLRKRGTIANWTNTGDSAFNCTYKFQFTETQNINCAGGHWAGSGDNNLYAVANFPEGAQTFNNGENLTVRWVYTYNAN